MPVVKSFFSIFAPKYAPIRDNPMNKHALLLIVIFLTMFCGGSALAQDVDEWFQNGRPECSHGPETDAPRHGIRRIGSQATAALKAQGVKYVPVVLVSFSDIDFSVSDKVTRDGAGNIVSVTKGADEEVNQFYRLFCNGTMDGQRYTGHGSYGSIRDYFVEQSDSIFQPIFEVIGPVKLDNASTYYGKNNGSTKDVNFSQFRDDALQKAMATYTEWSKFDNDANNTIDMVFFIYAGMAESNTKGKYPDLIWPKEAQTATTINGNVVSVSAATCECRPQKWLNDTTETGEIIPIEVLETRTDGIGVFCHELSHALGLPDFYDTNNVAFGMDIWSVMDYGEYANNGYYPVNYTAYERDFMGWRRLETLTDPSVITIPCFADGGTGYKIVNPANPNEYYIIENRQAKGWDKAVGSIGHGLQVTHVDYDAECWKKNIVNTEKNHQRMTIIAANNRYVGTNSAKNSAEWQQTLRGNLYPGDTGNTSLTDDSTPAATVFTGGKMGHPLCYIVENDDATVTVYFHALAAPPLEAEKVDMDEILISWPAMPYAEKYVLESYLGETLLKSEEVTTTSKLFTDLQLGTTYSYRIKALSVDPDKNIDSDWGEFLSVKTLTPVTLTANDVRITYGDDIPTFTYSVEGTDLKGEPALSCEATSASSVGTYPIAVSAGTIPTHNVTYVDGLLTIEPASLTITAQNMRREQGQENPDFLASYEGFKNDEDESVLTTPPSFTCLATPESPVGAYEIVVYGAEAENYDISYVNGVLDVITPVGVASLPDSEQVVDIYSTSGMLVSHCYADQLSRLSLRAGIYIIRYANGAARKVLIK